MLPGKNICPELSWERCKAIVLSYLFILSKSPHLDREFWSSVLSSEVHSKSQPSRHLLSIWSLLYLTPSIPVAHTDLTHLGKKYFLAFCPAEFRVQILTPFEKAVQDQHVSMLPSPTHCPSSSCPLHLSISMLIDTSQHPREYTEIIWMNQYAFGSSVKPTRQPLSEDP